MAHQPLPSPEASSLKLTEHHALIFDVYGTLVDWESAIHDAFAPLFPSHSREDILINYAEVEGRLQMQSQSTPYSKILELAYRQLADSLKTTTVRTAVEGATSTSNMKGEEETVNDARHFPADNAERFGRSIPDWKPFPDTIDALHRLKRHFALVVLSNVDDKSFSGTHEKLCSPNYPGSAYPTIVPDSPFTLILTAQQVGAYKPNPLMLGSALKQLSARPDPSLPSNPSVLVDASRVLVVANSVRHDIIPALQRELRSVWISRHGINVIGNEGGVAAHCSSQEGVAADGKCPYTWRYETLGSMANAVEVEIQASSVLQDQPRDQ